MIEVCDSDADIETLRKMIKMQAGEDLKLTRKQMCDAYDNIHASKLPLPPLVMTSDRTYLLDRASPLKHMEYELLFDSSTKRVDLKRIARKVGLTSQIEQMTKKQLTDAIGKRLRYLKVHEPVKLVTKRLVVKKESNMNNTAVNNTAVNNTAVNNTAVNNTAVNNTAVNNTAVNSNANRYNNTAVNSNANRYNNTAVNSNANRYNNTAVNVNSGTVNVSGNKPGVKLQTNIFGGPPAIVFPKRLSFKPTVVASKTNSGSQMNDSTGTNSRSQTSFNNIATSTGTNAGPTPTQFGNGFKKKPSFLAAGPAAPGINAIRAKQSSFANKIATKSTNAAAANGPKKPGMFNWMSKKKNVSAAGAAAGAAAAGATVAAAAANAPKKCGMMNRMMGRCKKNVATGTNTVNTGVGTNNQAGTTNMGAGTNNQAGTTNMGVGTNNQPSIFNALTGGNKPKNTNNDINYVANKIMNEVNKDVRSKLRNNGDDAILKSVSDDILDDLLKKDITNRVNAMSRVNAVKVRTSVVNDIMNQLIKKDITPSINKRVSNPKVNITGDVIDVVMKGVKSEITNVSNNKKDINFVENKILNRLTQNVKTNINNGVSKTTRKDGPRPKNVSNNKKEIDFVANKILNRLTQNVKTNINNGVSKTTRKGGRAAEPNKNNVFENASNKTFKINNNVKMMNNPLFNNNNGEISASSLTKNNIKKSVNNIPEEVEKQENVVRNMVTNLNSERNRIKNKVTKELNLRPDNTGVFSERRGLDRGRIGQWAKELREADTIDNLKNIESKLNQKAELRKNIENKYTRMGLTKVEKMDHRRKVVQFANNANARRTLVEIQVKNKKSNNNNTNSVISNYNSNVNSNEPNKKMKYGSRENFINAKKVELRDLAKGTRTNFSRNINRLENRTNVAKLRGRIEGAILRNEPKNSRQRSERRVDNRALLKKLKKDVKKKTPGLSPAKINAEARRLFRSLSEK